MNYQSNSSWIAFIVFIDIIELNFAFQMDYKRNFKKSSKYTALDCHVRFTIVIR